MAKIEKTAVIHQVLDNCHAAHHISLALAALGLNEKERMPLYRELRTKLRNGQWRSVVEQLEELLEAYRMQRRCEPKSHTCVSMEKPSD